MKHLLRIVYGEFKKIAGVFFTWSLILIYLTGGKITIEIGLSDWIVQWIQAIK